MKRYVLLVFLAACAPRSPEERYAFVTLLGSDTISVENVTRRGNRVIVHGADRFPRVRQRRTEITLDDSGAVRRLVMDITTPSEPSPQRQRRVVADVTRDSVKLTKRDSAGGLTYAFATGGGVAMPHVPQMYSLYELYLGAALRRLSGDTARVRQFYIDREFDRFPLHHGRVRRVSNEKAEIAHDWLAGIGEATLDSANRLVSYSGHRTTYKVDVHRVADSVDVAGIAARFASAESSGGVRQLSVRDTVRASIGEATFTIDYSRPLARGRVLLGNVIPYDRVWRTGANAATQFRTSHRIALAGMDVPAGTYTLWTLPKPNGVELIVNQQTGQWGTGYDASRNLGRAAMTADTLSTPIEAFTISIVPVDARRGLLNMAWGPFRWTAPILVR